ncbi:hypothetical protein DFH07DRAFT_764768 [Mycena maculata]|uniref:Uncharacterized protein n=1 Tax=Mycena maculata TaxID=230809 RepID=A0AAD7KAS6_9AGAR|nr:hypothetical protein DFH07DRAFT_764768 [Mycena maculata]
MDLDPEPTEVLQKSNKRNVNYFSQFTNEAGPNIIGLTIGPGNPVATRTLIDYYEHLRRKEEAARRIAENAGLGRRRARKMDKRSRYATVQLKLTKDPVVRTRGGPSSVRSTVKATSVSKSPHKIEFLPIKAWYLGRKLVEDLFGDPYYLVWTPDGKMLIKSGDVPSSPCYHSEEVDLTSIAKCVWFVDPNEDWPDKVFVVETLEKTKRDKIGDTDSVFFKQGGKHGKGDIVIKFDSSSTGWTSPTYTGFVNWLKANINQREIGRGMALDAKWETVTRMARLAQSRVRRGHYP